MKREIAVVVGALGLSAFQWGPAAVGVPTARVKKADLALEIHGTGELKPAKSVTLTGPPVGGTLQIVSIKPSGTKVEAKETVVEFDPSEQEFNLEQAKSEVHEVEQLLAKQRSDIGVQAASDEVAVTQARFEVRRAELDSGRNELLAPIDARKNVLAVEEAKRRYEQLTQDATSRTISNNAKLAVLRERLLKAQLRMHQAQKALEDMKLTTPVAGIVSILENRNTFAPPGMSLPEYRPGDITWPGNQIVTVAQPESMEVITKVDESDRASVEPGQAVEVVCEGLPPGVVLQGKVKRVANMPSRSGWWAQIGSKKFDMVVELVKPDPRLRSGHSARVKVRAKELKDALQIPRQAVFEKDGKPFVYVRKGSTFETQEVKVLLRNESVVALEGLEDGTEVALADPEGQVGGSRRAGSGASPALTGGSR
jgi:HlyD family secretion protein